MALAAYLQCCTDSSRFATPQQATTARTSTVRLMLLIALQNQQLATYIQAASRCNHPVAAHSLASCNYAVSSTFVYMCVLAYVCVMSMCVCEFRREWGTMRWQLRQCQQKQKCMHSTGGASTSLPLPLQVCMCVCVCVLLVPLEIIFNIQREINIK